MGRFTSVQAYADNNANLRKLTYEQATGVAADASASTGPGGAGDDGGAKGGAAAGGTAGRAAVATERVVNPYGSTAGAGSGEFHVYRHARAREAARWKSLDEEQRETILTEEFVSAREGDKSQIEAQTEKRRKKRRREKDARERRAHLEAAGIPTDGRRRQRTAATATAGGGMEDGGGRDDDGRDEFVYVPRQAGGKGDDGGVPLQPGERGTGVTSWEDTIVIPTDGSFLEVMKKKLEEEREQRKAIVGGDNDDGDEDAEGPMLRRPAEAKHTSIVGTAATTDNDAGTDVARPNNVPEASLRAGPTVKPGIVETKIFDEDF